MQTFILALVLLFALIACAPAPTTIPPGSTRPAPTPSGPSAPNDAPTSAPATPALAAASDAIALAQKQFPELKDIKPTASGTIGASTNITVQEMPGGWNLIFWKGSGDCPSGCINHHFWYISVDKTGKVAKAGEYVKEFDSAANNFKASGAPMWGVPAQ